MEKNNLPEYLGKTLEKFKVCHKKEFGDERLANRWKDILIGISGAKTSKIAQIAAYSPHPTKNIWYTQKAMYEFLKNPRISVFSIMAPLYEKTKRDFSLEKEIIAIIDLSSIEKPYARKMEEMGKVIRKDKKGTINGYMSIAVIFIAGDKTGIAYFDVFSPEESWQNLEIKKAIEHTSSLLSSGTNVTWVWDRGFDDKKNYRRVSSKGSKFVGRFYHDRKVKTGGKEIRIFDLRLREKLRFKGKIKWSGKKRKIEVELSWGKCKLEEENCWVLRSEIVKVEGIEEIERFRDERVWYIITNHSIRNERKALMVWDLYRKRWRIEEFFRFLKVGLGLEEFQILGLEGIRRLLATVVIGGSFIYDLGASKDIGFIQIFGYLGGWNGKGKLGKYLVRRGISMWITYFKVGCFIERIPPREREMLKEFSERFLGLEM